MLSLRESKLFFHTLLRLSILITATECQLAELLNKDYYSSAINDVFKCCRKYSESLCLFVTPSGQLSVYREEKLDHDLQHPMIICFEKKGPDETKATLVGGRGGLEWIALAFSDLFYKGMARGGPSVMCIKERDSIVKGSQNVPYKHEGFVGEGPPSSAYAFFPSYDKSNPISDSFDMSNDGFLFNCIFSFKNKLKKYDGTVLDLVNDKYYVFMAQGNAFKDSNIDNPAPMQHETSKRYYTISKYYVTRPLNKQTHIEDYLPCGQGGSFCFGAGFDGCGMLGFNCKFFTKIERDKGGNGLTITLRGVDVETHIGIGFSFTNLVARPFAKERWENLRYLVVCDRAHPKIIVGVGTNCSEQNQGCSIDENPNGLRVTIIDQISMNKTNGFVDDTELSVLRCKFSIIFDRKAEVEELSTKKSIIFLFGGSGSGRAAWKSNLRNSELNEETLDFTYSGNNYVLLGNEDFDKQELWQILEDSKFNIKDPSDLNPHGNGKETDFNLQLHLLLIVTFFIILV